MKKAVFPGTFDPPSLGHLDIIQRASKVCDRLYVGIALNVAKPEELFSVSERKAMLEEILKPLQNVEVVTFESLVVDYVQKNQIDYIVRGLRALSNSEYEFRMALANRKMSGVETVFLMADESLSHISSSLIKEIGSFGHRLHDFVPKEIEEVVFRRISEKF
ncbi:MAG: Phosphopantetheine adenylyltransferase [Chlamydiae bacterium]|nr:Phosphopantetheine adenylyltransferase [Chlamydiota bacterium]